MCRRVSQPGFREHGDRRTAGVASCRRPVAGHRSGPDHPALPECPPGADPEGPAAYRLPAGRPALRHHVDYRDPDHRVLVRTRAAGSELVRYFDRDQGSGRRDDRRGARPLRYLQRFSPSSTPRAEARRNSGWSPAWPARPGSPCSSSSAWSERRCSVIPTRCSGPSASGSGQEHTPVSSTRPTSRSRIGSLRSGRSTGTAPFTAARTPLSGPASLKNHGPSPLNSIMRQVPGRRASGTCPDRVATFLSTRPNCIRPSARAC